MNQPCDRMEDDHSRDGGDAEEDPGLRVELGADGAIYLRFDKPISWISFDPPEAIELGKLLIEFGKSAMS